MHPSIRAALLPLMLFLCGCAGIVSWHQRAVVLREIAEPITWPGVAIPDVTYRAYGAVVRCCTGRAGEWIVQHEGFAWPPMLRVLEWPRGAGAIWIKSSNDGPRPLWVCNDLRRQCQWMTVDGGQ